MLIHKYFIGTQYFNLLLPYRGRLFSKRCVTTFKTNGPASHIVIFKTTNTELLTCSLVIDHFRITLHCSQTKPSSFILKNTLNVLEITIIFMRNLGANKVTAVVRLSEIHYLQCNPGEEYSLVWAA